ncbi:biotin/lipoyl-containing protein, partial [Propionicimonas sp.]|uniref:biotin/lipoyl-containing protein n=1 Tax=Propionicimonas sp. TaxID=1955623 RepID=UPI0039E23901
MSMTMEFGTIVEWLVGVGDKISNGDAVVVVTTDKVDMEVEATFDAVLEEIVAGEGAQLPVGEPIAYLQTEADDLLGDLFAAPPAPAPAAAEAPVPVAEAPTAPVPGTGTGEPVRAVP